jgi:hypothetical protein
VSSRWFGNKKAEVLDLCSPGTTRHLPGQKPPGTVMPGR